jgi:hypothetical protein
LFPRHRRIQLSVGFILHFCQQFCDFPAIGLNARPRAPDIHRFKAPQCACEQAVDFDKIQKYLRAST